MAAEGGNKVVKYLMFFFNFIIFVFGIAIIVGAALTFTVYSDYFDFTGNKGKAVPMVLLVIGIFILFTGFFGCCGAIRENYCMLFIFAIIMVLLLMAELAGGIAAYVLRNDIKTTIDKNMKNLMKGYLTKNATKTLFDGLQKDLQCCGTDNYTDWYIILGENNTVPESCCKKETPTCGQNFKTTAIFIEPCFNALYNRLEDNIIVIGAIAIAVALVQIFGVICSCCLMRSIKSEYEVV